MSGYPFLLRELLGAIRTKSAVLLALAWLFLFLFLTSFALFFLFGAAPVEAPPQNNGLAADEVIVSLSPRLSAATIDALYLQIQDRPDVARINFQFEREIDPEGTGGRFRILATSPAAVDEIVASVRTVNGVTEVAWGTSFAGGGMILSAAVRIGLLCALVISVALSLLLSRRGFRALLESFAGEIRLLRLSGLSERQIQPPIVGIGVLIGLLAGLLLVVGLVIFRLVLGAEGTVAANAGLALASEGKTLGIGLGSLFLGLVIGGLFGLFGASVLSSREFSPLP